MRTPNSCVRCDTDVAITPVMPVTVTSNASPANTDSSVAVRRGVASDTFRISSSVRTFSIGTSGSTACTASRMIADGGRRIASHPHQRAPLQAAAGLPQRLIDLRHRFAIQSKRLDVADHSDDRAPRLPVVQATPPNRSDRAVPVAHHRLVDDDDAWRFLVIELDEHPSAPHRDAERVEVAGLATRTSAVGARSGFS